MLGPSVIVLGTPVAFVASISALRNGPDRLFAIFATCLSSLELLGLLTLLSLFFFK